MTIAQAPLMACSICGCAGAGFDPGPNNRPDATCPECGSLERHRFLYLLLSALVPSRPTGQHIVEVAPSPWLTPTLRQFGRVIRLDLKPKSRKVDVAGDLTALPFADASIDIVVCYHVLEHVPDDLTAMREIRRILAPDGFAFIQVPVRAGRATDEDPSAPEAERIRRFGQRDHVRWYGDDFETRLQSCGLAFHPVVVKDLAPDWLIDFLRLVRGERLWICYPDAASEPPPLSDLETTFVASYQVLITNLAKRSSTLRSDERRIESLLRSRNQWQRRYRRLRQRRSVRLALRAEALLKRRPGKPVPQLMRAYGRKGADSGSSG
jgi:SAM-dependent methyltransferase